MRYAYRYQALYGGRYLGLLGYQVSVFRYEMQYGDYKHKRPRKKVYPQDQMYDWPRKTREPVRKTC